MRIDQLLLEPGTRIEAPAGDLLAVVYESTWLLLRQQMADAEAYDVAALHLQRVHAALAAAGYVVRDVHEDLG